MQLLAPFFPFPPFLLIFIVKNKNLKLIFNNKINLKYFLQLKRKIFYKSSSI